MNKIVIELPSEQAERLAALAKSLDTTVEDLTKAKLCEMVEKLMRNFNKLCAICSRKMRNFIGGWHEAHVLSTANPPTSGRPIPK